MRRRIIEALTYPRMFLASRMDVSDCPMNGYFTADHQTCQTCEQGQECRWLNDNDQFSVLAEQPMETLFEALLFSIDYLDAHVSREKHNSARCMCDICNWVRDARHLAREYQGHTRRISTD